MRSEKIKKMALTALSAAFIALCSWLTIPFPVPFTMQTFAVFLILLCFGGKVGVSSVLIYILLGAFGIPVFSGFGAGIGVLFGPSGGFIFGFLLIGVTYLASERFFTKKPFLRLVALSLGLALCYLAGTLFFMLISNDGILNIKEFVTVFSVFVLPYLLPDALKLFFAFLLHQKLKIFKV